MGRFELPISGPPDQHFNRTKLHPESERKNMNLFATIEQIDCFLFVDLYCGKNKGLDWGNEIEDFASISIWNNCWLGICSLQRELGF